MRNVNFACWKKTSTMSSFTYFATLTFFNSNQNIISWYPYRTPAELYTYLPPTNKIFHIKPWFLSESNFFNFSLIKLKRFSVKYYFPYQCSTFKMIIERKYRTKTLYTGQLNFHFLMYFLILGQNRLKPIHTSKFQYYQFFFF